MSYRKTTERLEKMLVQEGFQAYPTQPNKFWNADGRIVWTDGSMYKESTSNSWQAYTKTYSDSPKNNFR